MVRPDMSISNRLRGLRKKVKRRPLMRKIAVISRLPITVRRKTI